MSDIWYQGPFELPPFEDGLGRTWAFSGEQVGGPVWDEPHWPEDWPEDLRYLLFQAEVNFELAERTQAAMARVEEALIQGVCPTCRYVHSHGGILIFETTLDGRRLRAEGTLRPDPDSQWHLFEGLTVDDPANREPIRLVMQWLHVTGSLP